jgi:hypothetical protein
MRFAILYFFTAWIFFSCSFIKFSTDGTKEKEFVTDFITLMMTPDFPDYTKMLGYIAPSFIEANNIDIETCRVNNYSVHGYSVISWDKSTALVTCHIWGKDKLFTHEILFKIVIENRKFWLMPSKYEDNWIYPWHNVKTYI